MDQIPNLKPVREFRKELARHFRVERVILFGSRARGDAKPDSDWDVVVVSPDFQKLKFRDRISRVSDYWDYRKYDAFEPLPYTPEEFKRMSAQPTIVREALREGRLIE